jgi:hypothetical protein
MWQSGGRKVEIRGAPFTLRAIRRQSFATYLSSRDHGQTVMDLVSREERVPEPGIGAKSTMRACVCSAAVTALSEATSASASVNVGMKVAVNGTPETRFVRGWRAP